MKRSIKIAGIQMWSEAGKFKSNQEKALKYIEEAAGKGADIVLLPELFSCGFVPNKNAWRYIEKEEGETYSFLVDVAKKYNIIIGAGLIEYINGHCCNTYLLISKEGELMARSIKDRAEAYVFHRGKGVHVFDTPLGRIGIGICADNHFTKFIKKMQNEKVKILLMPHALPVPKATNNIIPKGDVDRIQKDVEEFPNLVQKCLGIPVAFVNQTGYFYPMVGIMGKMMDPDVYCLAGYSKIIDSNGDVVSSLDSKEGIVIGEIFIDKESSNNGEVPDYSSWVQEGSTVLRRIILPIDILIGKIYYFYNRKIKKIIKPMK